jgi:putative ABC transport system substrate-binding protein
VRQNVDVIVSYGAAVVTFKQATASIPIVFAVAVDPVGIGIIASLARPGGNITGLSIQQAETASKRIELLRVAPAFEALKGQADALYVVENSLIHANGPHVAALALKIRVPTTLTSNDLVEAGGLMSYGPNFPDLFRRAADYVDKILRGAKSGELPVEQPTKFESTSRPQSCWASTCLTLH